MAIGYRCEGCKIVRSEQWQGTCPGCGGYYNCRRTVAAEGTEEGPPPKDQIVTLSDVSPSSMERISCGFPGIDRILGSDSVTGLEGIAAKAGQAIQIYGAPGSGKSTLLLQICRELTKQRYTVLYIAGEENLQQVKARADRIGKFNAKMIAIEAQELDVIVDTLDEVQPTLCVIDSIQTVSVEEYAQGSLTAMRIAARELYRFTQTHGISLFLVTQMNKQGDDFAGPKEVEHIVDTSLYLRVDRNDSRVLEALTKNRFGPTPASQRFQMTDTGLVEIAEPAPPVPAAPPSLITLP